MLEEGEIASAAGEPTPAGDRIVTVPATDEYVRSVNNKNTSESRHYDRESRRDRDRDERHHSSDHRRHRSHSRSRDRHGRHRSRSRSNSRGHHRHDRHHRDGSREAARTSLPTGTSKAVTPNPVTAADVRSKLTEVRQADAIVKGPTSDAPAIPEDISLDIDADDEERLIRERNARLQGLMQRVQQEQPRQTSPPVPAPAPSSRVVDVEPIKKQPPVAPAPKQPNRDLDMFDEDIAEDALAPVTSIKKSVSMLDASQPVNDDYDDSDGYYKYRIGEVLKSRYRLSGFVGQGVFGTVCAAVDLNDTSNEQEPTQIAVKIIRNRESMKEAGEKESKIMQQIARADPAQTKYCLRLIDTFDHRGHLVLVTELMWLNLRSVLGKFGKEVGLNITAVRVYTSQLLLSLQHLMTCELIHADIKPDNILINSNKTQVRLADFGSAFHVSENTPTPYLESRFYRAPEVILGVPYSYPIDLWAVGATLFELCTGKILFPGRDNNDMLRLMMEVRGKFPAKMLRKGIFSAEHFEDDVNQRFKCFEIDPVTKQERMRSIIVSTAPQRDIGTMIDIPKGTDANGVVLYNLFKDLLDKMLMLDPNKRISVDEALNHPFVTGRVVKR